MAIWGKLIGGAAGFALGGPIGALIGAVTGHVVDKFRDDGRRADGYRVDGARESRQVAFTVAIIVLGAKLAKADGVMHPAEIDYLRDVADIFGFSERHFNRIHARHKQPDKADPYEILGVPHDISDAGLKSRHRKLVLENHPDKLIAQGMPEDFINLANDKLAAINAAHDKIRAQRGLK